jgi:DNA-binding HxlR family transcriptional regulator
MRKTTSSNYTNEMKIKDECAMVFTLSLISGRWKPHIFWRLVEGKLRYSEIRKAIPEASERMLVAQLREMESDKLVKRTVYAQVPPKVEYELTDLGMSLEPVFFPLYEWGAKHQRIVRGK